MHAGRGNQDDPKIVFSGLVVKGEHAEQTPGSSSQDAEPEQYFFGDAPLIPTCGVFVVPEEQEGKDAEGEEGVDHGKGSGGLELQFIGNPSQKKIILQVLNQYEISFVIFE